MCIRSRDADTSERLRTGPGDKTRAGVTGTVCDALSTLGCVPSTFESGTSDAKECGTRNRNDLCGVTRR